MGDVPLSTSPLRWKSFAKTGNDGPHVEIPDVLSPGPIFNDPNVEPDKVVLRPQNRNHLLLSPREQDVPRDVKDKKSLVTLLENHVPSKNLRGNLKNI